MGKNIFAVLFALLLSFSLNASNDAHGAGDSHEKEESNQTLNHVKDSHEWHILDYTDSEGVQHPVSVPLPVILWNGEGLDVFMSSEFHHGHSAVHKGDNTYIIKDDKIYFADEHESAVGNPILWDFSLTKNTISMFMSVALMLLIFLSVAKAYKKRPGQAPKGLQSFMEPLVLFVRDDIAIPNTSGWQSWVDVTINDVQLSAGEQILRVTMGDVDYTNLNYMEFISIPEPVVSIPLKTGWNLIGCPIDGSTNIDEALTSIWQYVEVVKDMNNFYMKSREAEL